MTKNELCIFGAICELMLDDGPFIEAVRDGYDIEAVYEEAQAKLSNHSVEEVRQAYLEIISDLLSAYKK